MKGARKAECDGSQSHSLAAVYEGRTVGRPLCLEAEIALHQADRASQFAGAGENDAERSRLSLADDGRHGFLENAGLFEGDLLQGVAEVLGVLTIDVGDGGGYRRDDVGGVEAPAQSHLDQCQIDFVLLKQVKSNRRGQLEIGRRRRHLLGDALEIRQRRVQRRVFNRTGVDEEALANIDDMGAGVAARTHAGRPAHGVDHGQDAAFSVGSGDVHAGITRLRVAGTGEQMPDVLEAQLDAVELQTGEVFARVHCGFRYRRSRASIGRISVRGTMSSTNPFANWYSLV